jgi:hypothetical protein
MRSHRRGRVSLLGLRHRLTAADRPGGRFARLTAPAAVDRLAP